MRHKRKQKRLQKPLSTSAAKKSRVDSARIAVEPTQVISNDMAAKTLAQPARLSYLAALDPWRRTSSSDVASLLKLAALTGRRLVISDNQAVNNSGFHALLRSEDVMRFLLNRDGDGYPPLCVAVRKGTQHFDEVVARLVLNRDQPAIFPWMTPLQQSKIDSIYSHKSGATAGALFDIGGEQFRDHIDRLNTLCSTSGLTLEWNGLEKSYVGAVSRAVQRYRAGLLHSSSSTQPTAHSVRICDLLLDEIHRGEEINRSNLYRLTAHAVSDASRRAAIQLKCLDEPYHETFASLCGCHTSITGQEYRNADVLAHMSRVASKLRRLRSAEIIEIDEFPLLLNQVPFARISSLRKSPAFLDLLDKLVVGTDEQRIRVIADLLNVISAELSKEPKGIRKLSKLRLHVLVPPRDLVDQLLSAGLCLSDLVAFASKAAGFLVGETVGWLVGVYGFGGILGTGAAMVVEQVAERAYERPKKHQEFQHVLQVLASAAQFVGKE